MRFQITAPDGRKVTISGDHEPTQEEASAIFAALPPAEAAPVKPDNWFTRKLTAGGSPGGGPYVQGNSVSAEDVTELAPAAAATAGGLLGNVPGAALGAAGGEAIRQLIRRAAGQPAATGVVQRASGLDPNSPEAAVAGIGAEAAVAPVAEGMGSILKWVQGALGRGAKRSFGNLLQPAKQVDKEEVLNLAARMETENIAPALSTRGGQIGAAEKALAESQAARQAVEAKLAGKTVPAQSVLDTTVGSIPENLPGGAVPKTGMPQRKAANRAAEDVATALEAHGGTGDVPFEVAQSEKRRWDKLLKSFYEGGRDTVPQGVEHTKKAADAWRAAIAKEFPEMGAANLRESELIDVTRLLKEAQARAQREGVIGASSEAAAVGAGVGGRFSIPLMETAKALSGAGRGPISSASAATKRFAAKLLTAPANTTQAWLRMADYFNAPSSVTEQESP